MKKKTKEQGGDELDLVPWDRGSITVFLDAAEFTSVCPTTSTPDFGRLTIEYIPRGSVVSTESMGAYLNRYREVAELGEVIVAKIADDFFRRVEPLSVTVTGHFTARNGISPTAVATRGEGA